MRILFFSPSLLHRSGSDKPGPDQRFRNREVSFAARKGGFLFGYYPMSIFEAEKAVCPTLLGSCAT